MGAPHPRGIWNDAPDDVVLRQTDANMNVRAMVNDSDATVVERYHYDPYGTVTVLNPDWSADTDGSDYENPILYCGYYRDSETGLYQVRHRVYHPTLGRWMQRDPVQQGGNSHQYAASAPICLPYAASRMARLLRVLSQT